MKYFLIWYVIGIILYFFYVYNYNKQWKINFKTPVNEDVFTISNLLISLLAGGYGLLFIIIICMDQSSWNDINHTKSSFTKSFFKKLEP